MPRPRSVATDGVHIAATVEIIATATLTAMNDWNGVLLQNGIVTVLLYSTIERCFVRSSVAHASDLAAAVRTTIEARRIRLADLPVYNRFRAPARLIRAARRANFEWLPFPDSSVS